MSIVISMFLTMIKKKYLITLEKNIKHINKKIIEMALYGIIVSNFNVYFR